MAKIFKLEDAVEYKTYITGFVETLEELQRCKEREDNVYIVYQGKKLYSMFDDEDSCYKKIRGLTKEEFEKKEAKELEDLRKKWAKEKQEAEAKIPEYISRGKKIIYKENYEEWENCVKARVKGLYNGEDVEKALNVMEALEEGKSLEEAKEIFAEYEESGSSASIILRIVTVFSKKGPEFCRANNLFNVSEESEAYLKEIEAKNALYEKNKEDKLVK